MSIYIKTEMKEMPKSCADCPRYQHAEYNNRLADDICHAENVLMEWVPDIRPSWCPLPYGQTTENK